MTQSVQASTPPSAPSAGGQTVQPIFHITHWKAGSEWVRAVMSALSPSRFVPRKQAHGHLREEPIRPDGIYSPVYLHHAEFHTLVTVPNRRFVVIRDLRDTLVSWYFSERYSHPTATNPTLAERRSKWEDMDKERALLTMIDTTLRQAAMIQRSWLAAAKLEREKGPATPAELIVRYEDLWADQLPGFRRICAHVGLEIPEARLTQVVERMSFESRSGGRKAGEEDVSSHFRKGVPGDWKNHFTPRMTEAFKQRFGDVLIASGYETSTDW